jgi:integrase
VLRELEKRRALVMLRRVRMWLKQMFEFALDAEIVPASPVPTGHLKSFLAPTPKHFPALTRPEDVPKLMRAIREYPQPVARMALLLSAYVWQRPSEVREAVWTEFDLDAAVWTIPAARMKMDREHLVPLAPQVVALLKQLQGIVGADGYLFPGWRYGKPLSEGALGKALDAMGYAGRHTPHGFRAMARTILEEHLGADPRYLEKQLAHEEPDKVRRAYSRTQFLAERRAVMAQWADWLDAQR